MSLGHDRSPGAPAVVDLVAVAPTEALGLTDLLGGKGANLAAMTGLGLPVPPGFVLTTALTRTAAAGAGVTAAEGEADLDGALRAGLARLEAATGQSLGRGEHPLLVSVRSGAPVSMPGMLDTVLNVGANRDAAAALGQRFGDPAVGTDIWLRFCRSYAAAVLATEAGDMARPGADETAVDAVARFHVLAAAAGTPIPDEPFQQLRDAVAAVIGSCDNARARAYRRREGVADDVGTAVVVQAMVYGNTGPRSGTGVVFSRDPSTGANHACGDFLFGAQGEDVVGGAAQTLPLHMMAASLPEAHAQLLDSLVVLERFHRDLCDVEFTVEQGRLWLLQCRVGRRSARAAVRMAVEMAEDPLFPLDRAGAVARINPEQLNQLRNQQRVKDGAIPIATGKAASPGVASGPLCTDAQRASGRGVPVILVRPSTSPADVAVMVEAAGIVTIGGGVMSHAAVVARGWGLPAVTGATGIRLADGGIEAEGHHLAEGTTLTIDGGTGSVFVGDMRSGSESPPPELATWQRWAAELGTDREGGASRQSRAATGAGVVPAPLVVVRTVRLRGTISLPALATTMMVTTDAAEEAVTRCAGLLHLRPAGLTVTEEGRAWLDEQLTAERAAVDSREIATIYEAFDPLDLAFKAIVTRWQLKGPGHEPVPNDHSDTDYDRAVLAELDHLHFTVRPLIDRLSGLIERLAAFGPRLDRAAGLLGAGDRTMMASPLKDSYHTVWFDLHEELLHLAGRARENG